MADRFYNQVDNPWQPKQGDYYTSTRADLELYCIFDESAHHLFTIYCDTSKYGDGVNPAKWPKSEFLEGFGINRVQVKPYIFDLP